MNIKARLNRADAIRRVQVVRKTKANMEFAAATTRLNKLRDEANQDDLALKELLARQSQTVAYSLALNPTLIRAANRYIEARHQEHTAMQDSLRKQQDEHRIKRKVLVDHAVDEQIFEKLTDRLREEFWKQIAKQEFMDQQAAPTRGVK